jgi:signal transduction histidine kinase
MNRPSALTLVTAALLVLLPTLAVMQYRWVGQVSQADRERMQTHVRNAAMQFREALDGEIARAVLNLQVGAATARDGFSDRYTDRYDAWLATSAHPQIVANVFLIDADGAQVQLRHWNQTTHVFEPAEWPDVLRPWQSQFQQELTAVRSGRGEIRRITTDGMDESLVISPVRPAPPTGRPGDRGAPIVGEPLFGFTVLQLDLNYVRTQLLPELAERYFMLTDADGYRVAVTSGSAPASVIYRSDPDAPTDAATADASEPLFALRGDVFLFNRLGNGRGGDGRRTVGINIFRGRDGGGRDGGGQVRQADRDFGRWLLIAQHRTGSLDAAVTRARNRNLGIGFGILLLLSLSIGMLTLTSRQAQRLARQQMEFVAGVSHELRTPIAVIKSAAENLSQGFVGTPERVKRYGDAINTEARRLGEMVEHVIQYSGLESGRGLATHAAVAPADLVDEAIGEATPVITAAGVHVDRTIADTLPPIMGDAVALRSAVQNLIANAVKYGGDDRWVGVRVDGGGTGRRGDVSITVSDHGAGIPAEELPHIFEPFYRGAAAVGRQVHGNGLGLSIVKRIVAAHNGRISVSTRPGEGSAFTITLPAADPAALAGQPDPAALSATGEAEAHS